MGSGPRKNVAVGFSSALFLAVVVGGCVVPTDPDPEELTRRVLAVRIDAPSYRLTVNQMMPLQAIPLAAGGVPVEGVPVAWRSQDPQRAIVDGDGRVLGVSPGSVRVSAEAGGATGSILLAIEAPPPPPLSVTLDPSSQTLWVGWSADIVAFITGGPEGSPTFWTCASSNASLVSVRITPSGCRATGVRLGTAVITVTASKGDEVASASVQMTVRSGG